MIRRFYILIATVIMVGSLHGQFVGRDPLSVSLFYIQKEEVDSAKKYIDLAVKDDSLRNLSKVWYYRGFIYKDLYKKREKNEKRSPFRLTAIESFKKFLTFDDNTELKESGVNALIYLAKTLYNGAVRNLDMENYKLAINDFEEYKKLMRFANPDIDMKEQDIQFKLALANMFRAPADKGNKLDSNLNKQIIELYLEVLELDPNNASANYNLAIMYYNDGADIINELDYDMDLMELNVKQDVVIELFLLALPHMKKSYESKHKLRETLLGLSNIYYGLNDHEKSDFYRKQLSDLEKGE